MSLLNYGYVFHFPPPLNILLRVKHLQPLSFAGFGEHMSSFSQNKAQHRKTINFLVMFHDILAASVFTVSSWKIVSRHSIAITLDVVLILDNLLK